MTPEEASALHKKAPGELARRALADREAFVFALRDMQQEGETGWGGEVRLCLNQNVVLHFVPRFDAEMPTIADLPQFAVMPDTERLDEDKVHRYEGSPTLDAFDGVVFQVAPEQYEAMLEELHDVGARFTGRFLLADTVYGGARFVQLVTERVLAHPLVKAEREFDFRKRTF